MINANASLLSGISTPSATTCTSAALLELQSIHLDCCNFCGSLLMLGFLEF
ncbi:hypothetical protein [Paenibacillus sp. TSA_86.1]|uniref:hypothetical protein n=1 Tax=Paenibacillus sp. TSA_86.1 TaxID=3415649 RepID=UPI004045FC66